MKHSMVWFGFVQSMMWRGMLKSRVRHSMTWYGMAGDGMVQSVWCVAPYSDPPTATAAPCQGRRTTPGSRSFLLRLICCLHAQWGLYQPPARDRGQRPKVVRHQTVEASSHQMWKDNNRDIEHGPKTESNVCMIKHGLTVNQRWDDQIWEEGARSSK